MNDLGHISNNAIALYIKGLEAKGYSKQEIAAKLQSIGLFTQWAYEKDHFEYKKYQHFKDEIAKYTLKYAPSADFPIATDQHKAISPTWASPIDVRGPPNKVATNASLAYGKGLKLSKSSILSTPLDHIYRLKGTLVSFFDKIKLSGLASKRPPKMQNIPVLGPTEAWPRVIASSSQIIPSPTLSTMPNSRFLLASVMTLLVFSILSVGIYDRFFREAQSSLAYPSTPTSPSTRFLSFQGRLTDSLGNPVVAATNMRFRLYTASSGGSTLYDSGTCSISPDQDGIHNVLIGSSCGSGIASSVFTENSQVWLGVTVGSDSEMTPRQQIANVPYAMNAETLQGLPAGTTASTVPYINQDGDLLIAASTPSVASTFASQTFAVTSANAITIQSAGSGDVTLTATGSGTIKFATGGSQHGIVTNTGLFGFGTSGPDAKLDVLATSGEQLRLTYTDGSVYSGFTTNSSGDLTIATTGGDYAFTDSSNTLFQIKDQGVYPFVNLAGKTDTGDPASCAEGDIYYNDTDDTIKICHESNTWEALDAAAGASAWDDITAPTDNLSLSMAAYNTTFTWDPGANAAETAFTLNFDGEDSSTDDDQVLMALNQTSNGADVTEAADALLTFTNSDANDPVENAIRFDAGAAGTDFTYGINFDAASIGTAELVLQNGETIDNIVDGTIALTGSATISGNTTLGDASGDTLTANAAAWTFANDTTIALSGGTNGLNFDSNTLSIDASNDRIGIGTAAPTSTLHVINNTSSTAMIVNQAYSTGQPNIAQFVGQGNTTFQWNGVMVVRNGGGVALEGATATGFFPTGADAHFNAQANLSGNITFTVNNTGGTTGEVMRINSSGNMGVGTSGPDARIDSLATSGEHLRLTYTDGTVYTGFTVASTGDLTLDSTGGDINFANNDVFSIGGSGSDVAYNVIGDSTSGASGNLDSDDDLYVEGNLEVDGTIYGNVSGTITPSFTPGSVVFTDGSGNLAQDNASFFFDDTNNRLGIGDTTPDTFLDVTGTTTQLRLSYETGDTNYTNFTVSSGGDLTIAPTGSDTNVTGNLATSAGTTFGDASGDSVTSNAATWTFANDTAVALSGGVNGLNFDSNTLSIDATNNKIGIGTAAPDGKLHVTGAAVGKALTIFNETGDQDIIAASASGNTRFRIANDGTVYGGYFLDISNTAYGIDPAGTSNFGGYSMKITGGALLAYDSGAVGIGATSPTGKLQVVGDESRFGDAGSVDFATGDGDVYIEDALEVDGTLYTASIDTTFTAGSVVFAGTSGVLAEDNTNFFWDDSSNELGIGDTSPDAFLDVTGATTQLRLSYETGDTNYTNFTVSSGGDLTIAPTGGDTNVTGDLDVSDQFAAGPNGAITANQIVNIASSAVPVDTDGTYGVNLSQTLTGSGSSSATHYGIYSDLIQNSTSTGNVVHYGIYSRANNQNSSIGGNSSWRPFYGFTKNDASSGTLNGTNVYMSNTQNASTGTISAATSYDSGITNSTTGTIGTIYHYLANSPTNASGTITTAYGAYIADQSVGTNTTAYGVYIANQSGSSGNAIGLYIADADDYSIQLASTDGDAASGITFGTDTNIYRSAANTLHTDDSFDADGSLTVGSSNQFQVDTSGNITTSGDLAVNGDDISNDSNLTINAATYVRIGDTASPGSASGDDDLFVESDIELDGVLYLDGTLDTTFTAGSVVFAGTSGVLAQDNASFFFDDTNNRLGIGDTTPDTFVDITGTTTQLRLSYETGDTNYTNFTVSSGGDLTIAPTGGDTSVTGNLAVSGNTNLGDASTDIVTLTGKEIINFDTAATDQNALYINAGQNTATAGTLRGINVAANFWATSGTQTGVNGLDFTVQASGNGGTVTTMKGISAWGIVGTGATVGTFKLSDVANPSNSGTITSLSGYSVDNLTSGSNNTLILAGTTSIPTGNWGLYNSSSYSNYLAGTTGIGTTGPDAKLDVLSTTEQLRLTYADGSTYSSFTVSSGGDLTIAPSGGDTSVTGTLTATSTITGSDFICTDCLDFAEFEDTLDLDASLTLNQSTNTWTQNFTGDTTTGLTYNANSVTTGTAVAINSTATSFSSGTLLSLDWSPGSLNTNADDLFKINTTNNGNMSGYYINLLKNSSSVFNIDQSGNVITTGDIAVNGDDITSDGTLTIDAATDINLDADGADIVFKDAGTTVATFTNTSTDLTIVPAGGDVFITGNLLPTTDDTYILGSDGKRWADLYLGPETLHIGTSTSDEGTISYTTSTNVLGIGGTGDLAIDMTGNDVTINDRTTIGSTTAGVGKLTVTGAETGKALAIFNETGNQNIITASASGTTTYNLTRDGDVTQGNDAGALAVHGSQYSLVPNASFEVNSDGDTTLPDAWYAKVGTPIWVNSGSAHGDNYFELTDYLDQGMSACFPIGQETAGGTNRSYTISLWYGSSYAGVASIFRWGLYTYTSRSDCQTDTSPANPGFTAVNPGNLNAWSYGSGTITPADSEKWARVWMLNNDSSGAAAAIKVDGVLAIPTNITSGLDVAETYPSNAADKLVYGEIVAFGSEETQEDADVRNIVRTSQAYDKNAFGVIATQPGLVLDDPENSYNKAKVALKGRVPVLVTTENGPIRVGDPITASSIPGVGMKATRSGRIIGYAMTEWTSANPKEIDQVTVFVNPETYVDLSVLTDLQKATKDLVNSVGSNIKSGLVETQKLVANTLKATQATIDELIVSSFTAREATLTDAQIERLNAQALKAQTIEAESIESETIDTNSLGAKSATISGTLVADTVDSSNIREMKARLERLAETQQTSTLDADQLSADIEEVQKYITQLTLEETPDEIADPETYQILDQDVSLDPGSSESILGTELANANLEALTVTGQASMVTLTVADAFSAGDVFIQGESILSLGNELKLSALEKVNIMNGAVTITADGTITAKGEVIAEKGVRTNTLRPLETGDNLDVALDNDNSINIKDSDGYDVARIGADGSAEFKNLTLDNYNEATSSAVVIAAHDNYRQTGLYAPAIKTSAAASGNGILPAGENDIIIFNEKITAQSIVNLTATSSTDNRPLYVDKIETCSDGRNNVCQTYFRVAIDDEIGTDATFNWLIVN